MKVILRAFLINFLSLYLTTIYIPGLTYTGGLRSLLLGAVVFMLISFILVPLLKILFLPLNLLTLGLFAWLVDVLALYALTTVVSDFVLMPYTFPGMSLGGIAIPPVDLTTFWVAVAASFMIGIISNFLQWLVH